MFSDTTLEQCKAHCLTVTSCVAVTWGKAGDYKGNCALYNNENTGTGTKLNQIAAYRSCFGPLGNVQYFVL